LSISLRNPAFFKNKNSLAFLGKKYKVYRHRSQNNIKTIIFYILNNIKINLYIKIYHNIVIVELFRKSLNSLARVYVQGMNKRTFMARLI